MMNTASDATDAIAIARMCARHAMKLATQPAQWRTYCIAFEISLQSELLAPAVAARARARWQLAWRMTAAVATPSVREAMGSGGIMNVAEPATIIAPPGPRNKSTEAPLRAGYPAAMLSGVGAGNAPPKRSLT